MFAPSDSYFSKESEEIEEKLVSSTRNFWPKILDIGDKSILANFVFIEVFRNGRFFRHVTVCDTLKGFFLTSKDINLSKKNVARKRTKNCT